jgi:DNA primase large subunit
MIGEALFYDNELNEDQARGVSEYLRRKWIATADLEGIRTCVNWDGTSVGIEEIAESHLEVFPNPLASNSVLRVDLDQTAVLRLVSSNGKLLAEKNLNEGQQVVALERWMSSLTAGTYFLILQKANGETTAHQVVR